MTRCTEVILKTIDVAIDKASFLHVSCEALQPHLEIFLQVKVPPCSINLTVITLERSHLLLTTAPLPFV